MTIFVFDLETSGLPYKLKDLVESHKNCRIVQIAYRIFQADGVEVKNFEAIIKPDGYRIENESIHGISHDLAENEGIERSELFDILQEDLKDVDVLVGHNVKFDIETLAAECFLYSKTELGTKILNLKRECTMHMGIQKYGMYKFPRLGFLYRIIFDRDFEGAHNAMHDCTATSEIYFALKK